MADATLSPKCGPRIQLRRILHETEASILRTTDLPFSAPMHAHTEYELIYVVSGHGTEFVGGAAAPFGPGSLSLIGGNTPHLHLPDRVSCPSARCEILYFSPRIFPDAMDRLPEYRAIARLLDRSRSGVRFAPSAEIAEAWARMRKPEVPPGCGNIGDIASLLALLDALARSPSACCLAHTPADRADACNVEDPLLRIERYLLAHFREAVSLSEVAAYAGLTPAALCRYFRRRCGKRIFERLHEIRISQACDLLSRPARTIAQVAAETGFENLSHFNRVFRRILGCTPSEYRQTLGSLASPSRI